MTYHSDFIVRERVHAIIFLSLNHPDLIQGRIKYQRFSIEPHTLNESVGNYVKFRNTIVDHWDYEMGGDIPIHLCLIRKCMGNPFWN